MPYRAYHFVLGLAGAAVVVALLLIRANVDRHATTGPRWKQRLLAAGIILMAAFGLGPACKGGGTPETTNRTGKPGLTPDPGDPMGPATPKKKTGYAATAEWAQIQAVTKHAEAIAAGKRGRFPFDRAGKKKLLKALAQAQQNADALARAKHLALAEVGLLKVDLAQLRAKVNGFRPTEMKMATCYEPMARLRPAEVSMRRLQKRLPLLQQLAQAQKLHPAVVKRVLLRIETHLKVLQDPAQRGALSPAQKTTAQKLATDVQVALVKVKQRLGQPPVSKAGLEKDTQWQQVVDAWTFIAPLAAASSQSTTAQRKQAQQKLKAALAAVDRLVGGKKLTDAEGQLLKAVGKRLRSDMLRYPPKDTRVKCYDMAFVHPARASLGRLKVRLPLLQKLAAAGKVKPAVLARVLPTVRKDLSQLTDKSQLKSLKPDERKRATALAQQIRGVLTRLDKLAKKR